ERRLRRAARLTDGAGGKNRELSRRGRRGASNALVKEQSTGERIGRSDPRDRVPYAVVVEIDGKKQHERFAGRSRNLGCFETESPAGEIGTLADNMDEAAAVAAERAQPKGRIAYFDGGCRAGRAVDDIRRIGTVARATARASRRR